jgi:hypothetical protein
MPQVSRFFGIIIKMYYNDHQPPHFHAEYNEYIAEIGIETFEVLKGELPRRVMGLVLEWAAIHRDELRVNWENAREHMVIEPIAPLE